MKDNNTKTVSLHEYIEKQRQGNTFNHYAERVKIAGGILKAYQQMSDPNTVAFLNPDKIFLVPEANADSPFPLYQIQFAPIQLSKDNTYKNFAFGSPAVFQSANIFNKLHTNSETEAYSKIKSNQAIHIYTLSALLFYTCFGHNPRCGMKYYENLDITSERELNFFKSNPTFIFELKDNENRFVNGFQSNPWYLWTALREQQKNFWKRALSGGFETVEAFAKEWFDLIENFGISWSLTPCGERFLTMAYTNEYALVLSDYSIGNKGIRCRGCMAALSDRCSECKFEPAKRNALIMSTTVTVTSPNPDAPSEKLYLYGGKIVTADMLDPEGDEIPVFEVIVAKKADILGFRYLLDEPVHAYHNGTERTYTKGAVLALLPGLILTFTSNVKLIVPGGKEPAPQDCKTCVILSNQEVCDIVDSGNETPHFPTVKSRKDGKLYSLKCFDIPKEKNEAEKLEALMKNLQSHMSNNLSTGTLLYPKATVLSQGYCKDKCGYVFEYIPNTTAPLTVVMEKKSLPLSDRLAALLDVAKELQKLHEKGYTYGNFALRNVYYDFVAKKAYLVGNECISNTHFNLPVLRQYTPREVSKRLCERDKHSDAYAFAVSLFYSVFGVHPLSGLDRRSSAALSQEENKAIYTDNPRFIFNEDRIGECDEALVTTWKDLPDYVQSLFHAAFNKGLKPFPVLLKAKILQERQERPSMEKWMAAIELWINTINDNADTNS